MTSHAANPDRRREDWLTPDGEPVQRPTHVLAHLSDTHLTAAGIRYNGVLDADAALERAVAVLRDAVRAGRHLDAVVVSGDLTDTGDPDAYRRLETALGRIAGDRPTPPVIIFATGNHDVRRPRQSCTCRIGSSLSRCRRCRWNMLRTSWLPVAKMIMGGVGRSPATVSYTHLTL